MSDDLSTVVHMRLDLSSPPEVSFVVTVERGPDRGKELRVDGSEPARVLVGKSPSCALILSDPLVSRRHAALEPVGRRLRLVDLGSTNGTTVNGLAVADAALSGGEEIALGETVLRVRAEAPADSAPLTQATSFGRMVGFSREMRRLYPLCEKLAASSVPVILEGETGTGKEVLAESLHDVGPRAQAPFVVFDCTAVPPSLVESELFGHERGAFTGAVAQRKGVFEQAHGGTLLIDEIGDLDPQLQPKLLRALERSEVRRVGGDKWIKVDVRLLAATRRDLDREVQAGRFRDDLFHRLAVARIELPPLRERKGDIAVLAQRFAEQLGGGAPIPGAVLARWEAYAWPGNVRELRNAVARYVTLGEAELGPRAKPEAGSGDAIERVLGLRLPMLRARELVVEEFERRYIERILEEHGGNVAKAAEASGIAKRYFQLLRARRK
jgi:transcriptional regulator with GAF, ATPase, and Fis domain